MNPDDRARNRYFVISAIRMSGVIFVLLGALIVRGIVELPVEVGYVLLAVGLFDTFVVPQLLARKWRTPQR
jgi:hypothetical protein